MRKILIINDADFSSVTLDKVTPSEKEITWYSDNNRTCTQNCTFYNPSVTLNFGYPGIGNYVTDSSIYGKPINRVRTRFYNGGTLADSYENTTYAVYKVIAPSVGGIVSYIEQVATFTIYTKVFNVSEKNYYVAY